MDQSIEFLMEIKKHPARPQGIKDLIRKYVVQELLLRVPLPRSTGSYEDSPLMDAKKH